MPESTLTDDEAQRRVYEARRNFQWWLAGIETGDVKATRDLVWLLKDLATVAGQRYDVPNEFR